MGVLSCDCTSQMTKDFETTDEYRSPLYELLAQDKNALTIKVYSSLAGGVFYTKGFAEIVHGYLLLTCETDAGSEITFELCPWEVTFALTYDGELRLDNIYFQDNKLAGPDILRPFRSDD